MTIARLVQLERQVRATLTTAFEYAQHAKGMPVGSDPRRTFLGVKGDIVQRDLPRHQAQLTDLKMTMGTGDPSANKIMSDVQGMLYSASGLLKTIPSDGAIISPTSMPPGAHAGQRDTIPAPARPPAAVGRPKAPDWKPGQVPPDRPRVTQVKDRSRSSAKTDPGLGPAWRLPAQSRIPGAAVTLRGLNPWHDPAGKNREDGALNEALYELDHADGPPSSGSAPTDRMNKDTQARKRQVAAWNRFIRRLEKPKDAIPPTKRSAGNDALPPTTREGRGQPRMESESGWDIAIRGSRVSAPVNLQHAREARRRIRTAVAPAFAGALDKAVDAALLTRFAARHPGGIDAAKLRAAYAERATRAFAAEFVRLVGGQPPASAEDIALGAIIAVAIAQTTATYPIVPPDAVAPMAVVVHRALRPRLSELARMAAVIVKAATPPAAPTARSAAAHETAW